LVRSAESPGRDRKHEGVQENPNIIEGQMLEVTGNCETHQVFVQTKTRKAKFVHNMLVVPYDQSIACPCCYKKKSLTNSHSRACYIFAGEKVRLKSYHNYIGTNSSYMKGYNKRSEVVEKQHIRYVASQKVNPFGEVSLPYPPVLVSALCYIIFFVSK
jgi:hypothetical protein